MNSNGNGNRGNDKEMYYPFSYAKNFNSAKVLYSPNKGKTCKGIPKQRRYKSMSDYNYNFNNNSHLNVLLRKYMVDYDKKQRVDKDEYEKAKSNIMNKEEGIDRDFTDIDLILDCDNEENSIKDDKISEDYNRRYNASNDLIEKE